jgi:hypothetical protein
MEKQYLSNEKEKDEIISMKEDIVKNLERMLKKIDLDQDIDTIKFDIIQTLKILFQKNENRKINENIVFIFIIFIHLLNFFKESSCTN